MPKTPTNKRIVLKTGQNWGLKLLNLLKMANLTAHVEKEINLVDKCPFIEKANCNEGLVRLICDPLYWDWLQIVTLLLGSIPALAILLWYILACLGKYMDQIKGKNFKNFMKLVFIKFFRGRRNETNRKSSQVKHNF